MKSSINHWTYLPLLGMCVYCLTGCDSVVDATDAIPSQNIELYIENPVSSISQDTSALRMFNPDSNPPSVKLNEADAEVRPLGEGRYEVSGTFSGPSLTVDVTWSQLYESAVLTIATASKEFSLQNGGVYSVNASDYITSAFDADRDGDSNLAELEDEEGQGLNPRNSNLCTQCRNDVASHINRIPADEAPVIDGQYSSMFDIWDRAQFKDLNGDAELTPPDGFSREFRFASMHDDQNLYLFVLRYADVPVTIDRHGLWVEIYNIDQTQNIDPFNVSEDAVIGGSKIVSLSNGEYNVFDNDSPEVSATIVQNQSEIVWEAQIDLASLELTNDRFFLIVDVDLFADDGYLDSHSWEGVVVLRR